MKKVLFVFAFMVTLASCNNENVSHEDVLRYVDPFIGTDFHGHTFPGATVPFAMVQLSPDTHILGWDASSGYHYPDTVIYGFSHTHLSGTGIGDMGDVLLLPFSGDIKEKPVAQFKKSTERATPGYYTVVLDNYGVKAELTSTERVGYHRYTYENTDSRRVMLDLAHVLQPNWGHRMVENEFRVIDKTSVEGVQITSGWAAKHVIAYRITFSEPVMDIEAVENGKVLNAKEFKTKEAQVYFTFKNSDHPLIIKVALSPVDTHGAAMNMDVEARTWDFDKVYSQAREKWQKALSTIRIKTKDQTVKKNFYTALYHTMIAPYTYQDISGRFLGMNKKVLTAPKKYVNHTAYSLWDTYRSLLPLLTIVQPEKAKEWSVNLVQKYREGGILPKWPLVSNYTGTMDGYPAVAVIADVIAKGLVTERLNDALEAAERSGVYRPDIVEKFKGTRESDIMTRHFYFKDKYGFIPADSISESVSWGLEMAYYDWCTAQIAKAAGDENVYNVYMEKSTWWKKYYDPSTGLMRGKMADGSWRTPFRPKYSSHQKSDYVEGTAWQWAFFVPHDVNGLIAVHGSKKQFETMLDTLFTTSSEVEGKEASGDITGLIGQYAHGNEPSHHMAYLYNWTGSPWKTQLYVDSILYNFYLPVPEGIIGNEDCGQMSAWYVLSAMGIYQVSPGNTKFTIGRPIVDEALLKVQGGQFRVIVKNNSRRNKFVKEVKLNGNKLDDLFIDYKDIRKGGTLEFLMTDNPDEAFNPSR
ncbi:MAG: glycoside hydrolase family 92 protein [Chlorobi bacterium]|nr:glycoside hydrolase family 92 protein [Chlorobiota bacterium]